MNDNDVQMLLQALTQNAGSTQSDGMTNGYVDVGDAKVDVDRARRRGFPEVIYCEGKTASQIAAVAKTLVESSGLAFGTRCSPDLASDVVGMLPGGEYDHVARTIRYGNPRAPFTTLRTAVIAAGTSDQPVAEEACVTLETFGAPVDRVSDVGVAGLHRLLDCKPTLDAADILIVVAGMEGALPSVVGGLSRQPIIAVPTSIGYGTALGGITALFAMLTSCASGITVVNIDNGFGAAMSALTIVQAMERVRAGGERSKL
ncbi:MAG: nickel pincer cofactor biosynthesis protein LarB [bacterium]|nr:nickel pincer cofactor biosynthesis protein LarB [Candidatus Kapabacteria bacterium]